MHLCDLFCGNIIFIDVLYFLLSHAKNLICQFFSLIEELRFSSISFFEMSGDFVWAIKNGDLEQVKDIIEKKVFEHVENVNGT